MAKQSLETLKQGDELDFYVIQRPIGAGGMGAVYLAEDKRLGRSVALKVIAQNDHVNRDALERFILEAKTLAKLQHPNIVNIYGIGEANRCTYIAMEYFDGQPLSDLIRAGRVSPLDGLLIVQQIADGLGEAHKRGLIHRDIKPSNILVDPGGRAKLIDFGIAVSDEGPSNLTETGHLVGTINYMAPELFKGVAASIQSDLYSLGLVLYECIAGKNPFGGGSHFTVMERIREGHLSYQGPQAALAAKPLVECIAWMTNSNQNLRPISCQFVVQEIAKLIRELPQVAPKLNRSILTTVSASDATEVIASLESRQLPTTLAPCIHLSRRKGQSVDAAVEELAKSTTAVTEHVAIPAQSTTSTVKPSTASTRTTFTQSKKKSRHKGHNTRDAASVWVGLTLAGLAIGLVVFRLGFKNPDRTLASAKTGSTQSVVDSGIRTEESSSTENQAAAEKLREWMRTQERNPVDPHKLEPGEVIEPPAGLDPWPPVDDPNAELGTSYTFRVMKFAKAGDTRYEESFVQATVTKTTPQYIETRLTPVDRNFNPTGEAIHYNWNYYRNWMYRDGFRDAMNRSTVTLSYVGDATQLFPLRFKKGVRFDVITTPVGSESGGRRWKRFCSSTNRSKITTGLGVFDAIKIECLDLSGEKAPDIFYYSPELHWTVLSKKPVPSETPGAPDGEAISELIQLKIPGQPELKRKKAP